MRRGKLAGMRHVLAPLLCALALLAPSAGAEPFSLVVVGDNPNGQPAARVPAYRALIDQINATAPHLVIHVGDIKGGGSPCTDALLAERRALFDLFTGPVLYTPGDNEWSDCFRVTEDPRDGLERLAHLRGLFFADPAWSLGQRPLPVVHQGAAGYPENARLTLGRIAVITAHVVGSNNNLIPEDPAATAEFHTRSAAAVAWLEDGFAAAAAQGAEAIIVTLHAELFKEGFGQPWDAEIWQDGSGFKPVGEALVRLSNGFGKPVLLVHGDGHRFGMTRPLPRRAPHLMAVETFGVRNVHAVEILVDPQASYPFAVRPLINAAAP